MTTSAPQGDIPTGEAVNPALVGAALREARSSAGLTMTELALRAGVTQPFISQVESGKITPSLSTLYRVAQALNVAPTALLPGPRLEEMTVVRAGGGATIAQSDRPASPMARLLTGGGRHLEVSEYELALADTDDTAFSHPGEELVYVLAGEVLFELADQKSVILGPGDSVHFDASKEHRTTPHGSARVRFLLIAAHPHHVLDPAE